MRNFVVLGFSLLLLAGSFSAASAKEGESAFSVSPDSAYISLSTALVEARESIDMNIYMLTSKNIAKILATKAQSGVKVRVLVEGEPNGGTVYSAVKNVLDQLNNDLRSSGKKNELLVMTSNRGKTERRYVFDHAKYVVIDHAKVFISSDNFTGSAFPDPSRTMYAGGTRGWQVSLENSDIASQLEKIFEGDIENQKDVVPYDKADLNVKDPGGKLPDRAKRDVKTFGIELGQSKNGSLCASPHSLDCIVAFIRGAKKELRVEHLSLPLYWIKPGAKDRMNPIVEELLAAAKRGVQVKVLVNDEKVFDENGSRKFPQIANSYLVKWLNQEAASKHLPLEAALFSAPNTQTSYVHNKGMVADGNKVFVSSINGTENSVENNREIAISLETKEGARFFQEVFQFDWDNREN